MQPPMDLSAQRHMIVLHADLTVLHITIRIKNNDKMKVFKYPLLMKKSASIISKLKTLDSFMV